MKGRPMHVIAVEVLKETDNCGVMHGDSGLLDEIYERSCRERGRPQLYRVHPLTRWKRVLDALSKSPGPFEKSFIRGFRNQLWRCFRLPPSEAETQ